MRNKLMKLRRVFHILLGVFVVAAAPAELARAAADQSFARTPAEEAMCQAEVWHGHDMSDRRNWIHMHHWCDCIRFRLRALRYLPSNPYFKFNLGTGVGGCQYVIDHTTPTFNMLPYVYVDKGRGLMLLGDKGQAAASFEKAISLNPDFVPAYIELARFYEDIGNKKKGLETATEGLKHSADKTLKRMYLRLGGKEPFPEPIAKAESPAPAAEAEEAKPEPEAAEASAPVPATDSAETPKQAPSDSEGGQPKQPKSPYCRFCPD
jgi:tetratricopeptide (TPR) repeat protein